MFNHKDYNSRQLKTPVHDHINPCDFNELEFNVVDKNTLLVKEKKMKKNNDVKTTLLNSLENQIDQQLKKYDKILETTTLSNATVTNNTVKGKKKSTIKILCSSKKYRHAILINKYNVLISYYNI